MKEILSGAQVDTTKLEEAEKKIEEIETKGGRSTTNDPGIGLGEDLDPETMK